MEDKILIGEVCRQADCTPRTVRHYEAEGLVAPVAMTRGGRKLYGKETASIIRTAQLLKRLGYSLKDIRQIITLTKSRGTRYRRLTKKLRKMLSETISSMNSELELLMSSRRKIANLLEKTQNCEACSSPDCRDCGKLKSLRTLGLLEQ
jgi:DNA-binding transcriptional MerR regulator